MGPQRCVWGCFVDGDRRSRAWVCILGAASTERPPKTKTAIAFAVGTASTAADRSECEIVAFAGEKELNRFPGWQVGSTEWRTTFSGPFTGLGRVFEAGVYTSIVTTSGRSPIRLL